jgi:hypothetical protein
VLRVVFSPPRPSGSTPVLGLRSRAWRRQAALALVLAGMSVPAYSATYVYTGSNYATVVDHTTCTAGTCADYTTSMSVNGSFTTAAALGPNLSALEIAPLVNSYSFSDGLNTYTSGDPNGRIYEFRVSTDGSGAIVATGTTITLHTWTTGSSPHAAGDRFDEMSIRAVGDVASNNLTCAGAGTSSSGVPDTCLGTAVNTDLSNAFNFVAGAWVVSVGAVEVPTLSIWGLTALGSIFLALGVGLLRRNSG